MQLGLQLPTTSRRVPAADVVRCAREAEALGFDSVWTFEHLFHPSELRSRYPYTPDGSYGLPHSMDLLEPVATLAVCGGATRRVELGTAVMIPLFRHPVPLAKSLATLDLLVGGRLVLGLGVGWMKEEYDAVDVPFACRGERFEEHVIAMRRIWREGECAFKGEFYSWEEASFIPRPPRGDIPLLFGGHVDAVLRRVARIGDGWIISSMLAGGGTLEERLGRVSFAYYRDGLTRLRRFCDEAERDFGELRNVATRPMVLADAPPRDRPVLMGAPEQILTDLERLAALGISTMNLVVYGTSLDAALESAARIAYEILPTARGFAPSPHG